MDNLAHANEEDNLFILKYAYRKICSCTWTFAALCLSSCICAVAESAEVGSGRLEGRDGCPGGGWRVAAGGVSWSVSVTAAFTAAVTDATPHQPPLQGSQGVN